MPGTAQISARRRLGETLVAGYPLVLADPSFRSLFLVLLLGGTAFAMAMAYTSVWASESFNIGPQAVAMVFVVSGLAGVIVNPLVGMLSDRLGWRRRLIVGQLVVVSLAYAGYTLVTDYPTALGLVAFSSFSIMGLVLAMVNDLVISMPGLEKRNATRIVAAERTAWSIGVIIGPVVAAAIVAATGGTRPVFATAALIQLVTIVVVCATRSQSGKRRHARGGPTATPVMLPSPPIHRIALAALLMGIVLVMLPTQTRTMYLPLFVTTVLGEPPGMVGPLFTVTAITAVVTMPYIGEISDRFGAHRVLYVSTLIGFAYCLLQAASATYPQTLAIQLLIGLCIGLSSTAALIYLQQLMSGRAGAAGGVYVAAFQVTPFVAGLLLGPIAEGSGIPAAFATAAILCIVALVLLTRAHRELAAR